MKPSVNLLLKKIIRDDKKQKNRQIRKMSYVWWSCAILLFSIVFIVLSFVFQKCDWMSNVFLSIGSSSITGVVLYCLSNMRNNKKYRLQFELDCLNSLHDSIQKLLYFHAYAKGQAKEGKTETEIFSELLNDIKDNMSDFPVNLYSELGFDIDDPFDLDKMKYYKTVFDERTNHSILNELTEILSPKLDIITKMIREKEYQSNYINNRIL